jgi:RNA recognition motif-containing protein
VVEFDNPKVLKAVRRRLREMWIEDRLLKVRTSKDVISEVQADRTLVVKNLPKRLTQEQLYENFRNFGAITLIELPSQDTNVRDQYD